MLTYLIKIFSLPLNISKPNQTVIDNYFFNWFLILMFNLKRFYLTYHFSFSYSQCTNRNFIYPKWKMRYLSQTYWYTKSRRKTSI